ncbi:MAG: tripartite tricarboxylate transporter permease [Rhizobiaceae bacterium]|nr:tripartite tricarboxylate transporter permease [Rhizobiaceae bacterium]
MVDIFGNLLSGVQAAFALDSLLLCALGVSLGTLVGVLPGIGTIASLSMLMPLTYHLDTFQSLIMLAGLYYGAAYGGSTASILLNLPGTANTAVTSLDGYPMSQSGRGGIALFMTSIASFVGSMLGIGALVGLAPIFTQVAYQFGPAEYFSLAVLGLVAAAVVSSSSPMHALSMVAVGLLVSFVGVDPNSGAQRYSFGISELVGGVSLVALATGLFGIPEVIASAGSNHVRLQSSDKITWRSMLPTSEDWARSWKPMFRGAGVGGFFGALPGAGGTIATFISYAIEKRIHKHPEEFGKGAIEGIAAPESANNAAIQTAFIPTLMLGVPGDPVMALLLGVFLINGIIPGPGFVDNQPTLFWGLVVSFVVGNLLLLILNIPFVRVWIWILTIPYKYLYPAIIIFVCIGVYTVQLQTFDLFVVAGFGVFGFIARKLRFEPAPLLLGFVLGPLLEQNLRTAMILFRGDATRFLGEPLSAGLLGVSALLICLMAVIAMRRGASISNGLAVEKSEQ